MDRNLKETVDPREQIWGVHSGNLARARLVACFYGRTSAQAILCGCCADNARATTALIAGVAISLALIAGVARFRLRGHTDDDDDECPLNRGQRFYSRLRGHAEFYQKTKSKADHM